MSGRQWSRDRRRRDCSGCRQMCSERDAGVGRAGPKLLSIADAAGNAAAAVALPAAGRRDGRRCKREPLLCHTGAASLPLARQLQHYRGISGPGHHRRRRGRRQRSGKAAQRGARP